MGNTQPTHGTSYASMTCGGGANNEGEGLSLTLCTGLTLEAGTEYCFSLDLITRTSFGNSSGSSRLRIYGSSTACQTSQLLWASPAVTGSWQTYNFCFTPTSSWNIIHFRVVNPSDNFSALGMDNWVSTDGLFPPGDDITTPVTDMSYPSPVCASGGSVSPTPADGFTTGGTWSGGNGLAINPGTGVIDPGASTPGTYTVTYSVPPGSCVAAGSSTAQIVIVGDGSAAISYGGPYCTDAPPANVGLTGTGGGVFSAGNGLAINPGTGQITPSASTPGTYTVTYTVSPPPPCEPVVATTQVTITGPIASFTPTPSSGVAPLNVTMQNTSTGTGLTHVWSGDDGLASTATSPSHTYTAPGTYDVVLVTTDANGCSDTAFAQVIVHEEAVLIIPNVFSPNGDGANDTYGVISSGLTALQMEIYNRWGQVVGRLSNPQDRWDGRSLAGNPVPDGTYFHVLTVRDAAQVEQQYTGHITLLR